MWLHACSVGISAALILLAAPSESRQWTDNTGKYRVVATFVEFKDGRVRLRKEDGTEIALPLARLSQADRDFVAPNLDSGENTDKPFGYLLALQYAPKDRALIKKAEKNYYRPEAERVKGSFKRLITRKNRLENTISNSKIADFIPWPDTPQEMAAVDLRILLDKELVQSLRFVSLSVSSQGVLLPLDLADPTSVYTVLANSKGPLNVFATEPKATVEYVLAKFGKPARQNDSSLIYWKVGLSIKGGKIVGVFSAPLPF